MMKVKAWLLLASMLSLCAMASDKEDVTVSYVANASFEADNISLLEAVNNSADGLRGYKVSAPQGWTVVNSANAVSLLVTADSYTDNNFGLVTTLADGQQAYYLRMGWSTGATTVRQIIASLPKGKYQLQASVRSAYANQAVSSFGLVAGGSSTSVSFSQGSTGCMPSMKWSVETLNFEQISDASVTIGFDINWQSGGSCVMFDDVRLYRLPDDYVAPEDQTEQDVDSPTEGQSYPLLHLQCL